LGKYADEYFIFEDKVYDIENIIGTHPGGWELIKAIKGR
jgi:cytochrome b involved in lipid metabolism